MALPLAVATSQDALWALCLAVGGGCLLTVLSRKLELPTIVLLLLGGFALGPEGFGVLNPDALGPLLPVIVSLAVGLILFEGGLTLDIKDFTQTSVVIKRLLTVGVLTTWLGSALAAFLAFNTSASFALLMGSLVIVTGPTVIVPLLRRIRLDQKLGTILHWEAVLIDSIGVFVAILCFEWVVEGGGAVALPNFLIRIVGGAVIGFSGGYLIYLFMRKGWVPDSMINAFALASAMLIFGITELIKPEAGLLSVTVAGLIVGLKKPRQLREVKAFKAEITDLLIGLLFLLLVARLEFTQFADFFSHGGGWVLLAVILLIRPLSVFLSALGTNLDLREKALLSWVAPRGVVAASMASLFALSLNQRETSVGDPALLESFVYSVICATVLIQGLSSGLVARLLHVQRPAPTDWVIIGAHHFGRELARRLRDKEGRGVILMDTNARNVGIAADEGLTALHRDAREAEKLHEDEQALFGTGYVLALTDNAELNLILMQRWGEELGAENVFGWIPRDSPVGADQMTGSSVFRDLARPAVIGSEVLQGESDFASVTWKEGKKLPSGDWHPLFIRRGKQLRPVPRDGALKEMVRPDDEVICLRRSEGFLFRALHGGNLVRLECGDIAALYEQLAGIACEQLPALDKKRIMEDLGIQEKLFPAFLGHGIAIPHVYCEELDHRVCFVAALRHGIQLPDQDGAIDYVFFLLSPQGDTEGHLATLAEIARACHAEHLREQIKAATSIDDVINAIAAEL